MNRRLVYRALHFLLLAGISSGAVAQTKTQLDQRYPTVTAYSVRPNILLTVNFGRDGRVCQMVLEPRRYTGSKIVLVSDLSENEVINAVEEVVPESERGKRLDGLGKWLNSDVSGGFITTTYRYESMSIQFNGTVRDKGSSRMVATVAWPKRPCD